LRRDPELPEDRDAGAGERADRLGEIGRAVELDHVRAAFLDQADGRSQRALGPLLQRTERKVAAHQRARHTAAHRLADHEHLFDGDLERIGMAPQIDADRVTDGHDVHAGAVGDARDLIVPGDHAHDLSTLALHLQKRGNRHLGGHASSTECVVIPARGRSPRGRNVKLNESPN
jgi:hypothetical protein